MSMYTPI